MAQIYLIILMIMEILAGILCHKAINSIMDDDFNTHTEKKLYLILINIVLSVVFVFTNFIFILGIKEQEKKPKKIDSIEIYYDLQGNPKDTVINYKN